MPTDACVFFHACAGCDVVLRPKAGGLLRVLLLRVPALSASADRWAWLRGIRSDVLAFAPGCMAGGSTVMTRVAVVRSRQWGWWSCRPATVIVDYHAELLSDQCTQS